MKALTILISLFWSIILYGQDLKHSILRNDNDYVTYKDINSSEELNPKKVVNKFDEIIKPLKNPKFYSYKININDSLSAYTLLLDSFLKRECYVIIYDRKNNNITEKPISINIKWAFNNESGFDQKLLFSPLITFNINDSVCSCVLRERVHNGNVYNAVIKKQYSVNQKLEFQLDFCFEEFALTFDNQKIIRILHNNEILVYKQSISAFDYLGKILFDFKQKKILGKQCVNNEFCEILFTLSNESQESIFKEGYQISY